jgi:hypothetical protein
MYLCSSAVRITDANSLVSYFPTSLLPYFPTSLLPYFPTSLLPYTCTHYHSSNGMYWYSTSGKETPWPCSHVITSKLSFHIAAMIELVVSGQGGSWARNHFSISSWSPCAASLRHGHNTHTPIPTTCDLLPTTYITAYSYYSD